MTSATCWPCTRGRGWRWRTPIRITGLWTAAQQDVDATFIIARDGAYGAFKEFGRYLETTNLPGTDLPGLDYISLAAGYGIEGRRVEGAAEPDDALGEAFSTRGPRLIEVETAATPSGMFSHQTEDSHAQAIPAAVIPASDIRPRPLRLRGQQRR